jgi:hypothetical protein
MGIPDARFGANEVVRSLVDRLYPCAQLRPDLNRDLRVVSPALCAEGAGDGLQILQQMVGSGQSDFPVPQPISRQRLGRAGFNHQPGISFKP